MQRALAIVVVAATASLVARGQQAAAGAAAGTAGQPFEVTRTLTVPGGVASAAAFAPNGASLCTGGEVGDVILWDVKSGAPRWHVQPADRSIGAIAWPMAGDRVAVLGDAGTIHDMRDGREVMRIDAWRGDPPARGTGLQPQQPTALAWSSDGHCLAFQRALGAVRVVAIPSGDVVVDFEPFRWPLVGLAFAPDGAELCAGDRSGRVWRLAISERSSQQAGLYAVSKWRPVMCCGVGWCGGEVLSCGVGGDVRLGDLRFEHPGEATTMAVSPDGEAFAVGGLGGKVTLWRSRGADERALAVGGDVVSLAVHPDGQTIAVATRDGALRLLRRDARPRALVGQAAGVNSLCWSPDGSVVAVGSERKAVLVGPVGDTTVPGGGRVLAGRVGDEILVRQGGRLVARSGSTGAELQDWVCEPASCVFGPLPDRVSVVVQRGRDRNRRTERLDLATGRTTDAPGDLGEVVDIAWSVTGAFALATATDVQLRAADGRLTRAEDTQVRAGTIAFAPDGSRFVCVSRQGGARGLLVVRDGATGERVQEVECDFRWVRFVDDRTAVAHDGRTLSLWDATAWRQLASLAAGPIVAASLSPDRTQVAVATADVRVVRIRAAQ